MEESPDLPDERKPLPKHASPEQLASVLYEIIRYNYSGAEIRDVAAALAAMTVTSEQ